MDYGVTKRIRQAHTRFFFQTFEKMDLLLEREFQIVGTAPLALRNLKAQRYSPRR